MSELMSTPSADSRVEWAAPIPLLLLSALLLVVGAFTSSYEYLQFMRWVVFVTFGWSAFIAWHSGRKAGALMHLVIALVFNPFLRPHVPREIWVAVDLTFAFVSVLISWATQPSGKDHAERENLGDFFGFSVGLAALIFGVAVGVGIGREIGLGEVSSGLLAFALASASLYGALFVFHHLRVRFAAKERSK